MLSSVVIFDSLIVSMSSGSLMNAVGDRPSVQMGISTIFDSTMRGCWNGVNGLCEVGGPFEDSFFREALGVSGMAGDEFAQPGKAVIYAGIT